MQALLAKNGAQERAAFIDQRYALARKVKYSTVVHCIVYSTVGFLEIELESIGKNGNSIHWCDLL